MCFFMCNTSLKVKVCCVCVDLFPFCPQRSIRPQVVTTFELPGCHDMWTVISSEVKEDKKVPWRVSLVYLGRQLCFSYRNVFLAAFPRLQKATIRRTEARQRPARTERRERRRRRRRRKRRRRRRSLLWRTIRRSTDFLF